MVGAGESLQQHGDPGMGNKNQMGTTSLKQNLQELLIQC